MTALALMKLLQSLTVRTLEALTGIDAVTASRCVNRVLTVLEGLPLAQKVVGGLLITDTSSVRVASQAKDAYSGHKHQRCAKSQAVVRDDGQIVDVGGTYPGSVHDKTIWNKEFKRLKNLFDQLVLGDKAYAGGEGEGTCLLRPIKRVETAYKEDKENAKAFNRGLSKIRVRVEHAFARLKTWKVLSGIFPFKWSRLSQVMRAIAVIHNLNREDTGGLK